jgi:hypothetical protein
MLPGDGVATSPALNIVKISIPLAPPAITANKSIGFISTYGKYISCIPPRKCIIIAPGADCLIAPFANAQ